MMDFLLEHSMPQLTAGSILLRIGLSVVLGLLIGLEREMQRQPAGMRTHMLICVGAAIFTAISLHLPLPAGMTLDTLRNDPARIAAQIVSGIGFLGAGAIIKFGTNIRGITTAATIWATAAVGMAVGAGLHLVAIFGAVAVLVILVLFEMFEIRLFSVEFFKIIEISTHADGPSVSTLRQIISSRHVRIRTIDYEAQRSGLRRIAIAVRIAEKIPVQPLVESILLLEGVESVRLLQERK